MNNNRLQDNVYVTFNYSNTSGGTLPINFASITKSVPYLYNADQYEVCIVGFGTQFADLPSTTSGRVIFTADQMGISPEFNNSVLNQQKYVIGSIYYNLSEAVGAHYNYENQNPFYTDINFSGNLRDLKIGIYFELFTGELDPANTPTDRGATLTLHFRKKK